MPLLSNQGQGTGYTHYIRFTYEDLQRKSWRDFGTASDVAKEIAKIKAGDIVTYALLYTDVALSGSSNLILNCLSSKTGAELITACSLPDDRLAVNTGISLADGYYLAAEEMDISITVAGTISSLTAGEWIVALKILSPSQIAK